MRYLGIIITSLLITLVQQASGQKIMSLELARAMALEKSENVQIASHTITKSEHELDATRAKRLPSLSASITSAYLRDNFSSELFLPTVSPDPATGQMVPNIMVDPQGNPIIGADGNPLFNTYAWLPLELSLHGAYIAGLQLTQPIYAGGRIGTGTRMAGLGVEMAKENHRMKMMDAILEVDQAYWLYVSILEKVSLARKSVEFFEALERRVANTHQAGLATGNDLLRVQVNTGKARLQLQEASSGLELARMSLCRIIGLPLYTEIVPADTAFTTPNLLLTPTPPSYVTQRPEHALLSKNVAMEEKRVQMARAPFLPEIGIRLGYNFIGGIEMNESSISNNDLSVIASVNIPIFNWGEGSNRVSSARLSKQMAELAMNRDMELMQLEIEQARLRLNNSITRIEIAEKALTQAEENLRISSNEHAMGRLLLTDLLMAQLQWQEANSEVLDAKTSFRINETLYLRATGQLSPSPN